MKRKTILLGLVCVSMMSTALLAVETGYEDKKSFIDTAKKSWKTFKKDMKCAWRGNCTEEQQNRLIKQGLALAAVVGTFGVGGRWMRQRSLERPSSALKDLMENDPLILKNRYSELRWSQKLIDDREKKKDEIEDYSSKQIGMEGGQEKGKLDKKMEKYQEALNSATLQANAGKYGDALKFLNDAIKTLDKAYNKIKPKK